MPVQKLSSTDAFVVVDFPDAPASGVARAARKILQSSATDLARSATYSFAAFGIERSGASAGINAVDDGVGPAIDAFVSELLPRAEAGALRLEPAKGIPNGALDGLRAAAGTATVDGDAALVNGVVAATRWALGGDLDGRTVAVEGAESAPSGLVPALVEAGATVVDVWGIDTKPWLIWGANVDAILAGSKLGALTHQGTPAITARAIVPWGPIPLTTKAMAQLLSTDTTVVPDFVSIAGPLLVPDLDGDDAAVGATVADRVVAVLDDAASGSDGLFLASCRRAESFMATWQEQLPFGRPLAA